MSARNRSRNYELRNGLEGPRKVVCQDRIHQDSRCSVTPQSTFAGCTLNDGIHYATTPEFELTADTRIKQEFGL